MSQSNKVILVVLAVLAAGLLFLVLGSGACSGSGGGGVATQVIGTASSSLSQSSEAVSATSGGEDEMSYEEHLAKLNQMLGENNTPVGSDARSASVSKDVRGVSETSKQLSERGFADCALYADTQIDGTYVGLQELNKTSTEKYPSYESGYISFTGIYWNLYSNDGVLLASPISTDNEIINRDILLTELDYVVQYDALKNEYSNFTIDECVSNGVAVLKVPRIDKQTLDSYTLEQLKGL